jgi:PKD repeat protein
MPLDVTWDASGSTDSDGTIVTYDWDMDNDGTFEITDGGTSQPASYPDFGTYTVGVRVTDDDGATDETTASVGVLSPPLADLQADPATGTVPLDVDWHAEGSTDADGTVEQWDWDMDNDSLLRSSMAPRRRLRTFSTGGSITVGVRVTDNDGLTGTRRR